MEWILSHYPVLLEEVLNLFQPIQLRSFLDGTLGAGGHASALLKAHPEIESFAGIDRDSSALALAAAKLEPWQEKVHLHHGAFIEFPLLLKQLNRIKFDGILLDLGVSSMQLDQSARGFSFSASGPLDMRMDQTQMLTAAEIVNFWPESELGKIFRDYGEEKKWRQAARAIAAHREKTPITSTGELAAVLKPFFPWNPRKNIHPLTLIFQALRIAVNSELELLKKALPLAIEHLNPDGILAIISFHSLEDRLVKEGFRWAASDKWDTSGSGGVFLDKKPTVHILTKKPISASTREIEANPRSRSAKLRGVQKLL